MPEKKSVHLVHPKSTSAKKTFYKQPAVLLVIVLALTFIAFIPSLKNDFIRTWDDNLFITDNLLIRQLDMQSVEKIFTTTLVGAYVPIPVISFAFEYHFFGLNPLPFHVTNLLLHLLCTALVFFFLRVLKLEPLYAFFGALLFGIHPMHVESVAWITERKDLLYTLFYLSSLILYVKYTRLKEGGVKFLLLSLLFFILALFSKIQAVSLPLSLILIDYFLERPLKIKLITEKLPFIALSLVFGIAGVFILKHQGMLGSNQVSHLPGRILAGLYALSVYIVKFFIPLHLSALYTYPRSPLNLIFYLNTFILFFLGFLIYKTARLNRAIVFGSLFFLVNIIFLLQILAAGTTYLSDRYSYLSYAGLCFTSGWYLENIIKRKKGAGYLTISIVSAFLLFLLFLTFNRCKIWENGKTLWTDVIEKSPGHPLAYYNLGVTYDNLQQWDKAIDGYSGAVKADPAYYKAYINRGNDYIKQNAWEKAVADYSKALDLNPGESELYSNRGLAYGNLGLTDKAIADFSGAIGIHPDNKVAYANRGVSYLNAGQYINAITDFSKAIDLDPEYAKAYCNRGVAYSTMKQWEKAIADYTRAIEIDPRYEDAWLNRGLSYASLEIWEKAIVDFNTVIRLNPGLKMAYARRDIAYKNLNRRKKPKTD